MSLLPDHTPCVYSHQESNTSLRTCKLQAWSLLSPRFCPIHIFFWLVQIFIFCYKKKKTVLIYIVLSWVLWVILSNHQAWGSLWICAQLIWCEGSSGNRQTSGWCQKSWADLTVWRMVPFTQSWSRDIRYAGAGLSGWLEFGVLSGRLAWRTWAS